MSKSFPFLLILMVIAILICLLLFIFAVIGAMKLTDGCFMRYSLDEAGMALPADNISSTIFLKANANHSFSTGNDASGIKIDETGYGKWLNINFYAKGGGEIKFNIKGEVSLCRAYIPINNLQETTDKDVNGKRIPIPRTDEITAEPVALPIDAALDEWRNLTELYPNDHYVVSIVPDQKTSLPVNMKNWFTGGFFTVDCNEGNTSYSPICGRASYWKKPHVSTCEWEPQDHECNCQNVCDSIVAGVCIGTYHEECDWCGAYAPVISPSPVPYLFNGKFTSPWRANFWDLFSNFNPDCATQTSYILGQYQNEKYFWFTADNAAALLYRFDSSVIPTSIKLRGDNYTLAAISPNQSYHKNGENYKILLNEINKNDGLTYLQFRFTDSDASLYDNTGGYVLNIKQTKCRRTNGNGMDDTIEGRGNVEYIVSPFGEDPNKAGSTLTGQIIPVDADGSGTVTIDPNDEGDLWLRIKNDPNDYKDSKGQYQVKFNSYVPTSDFFGNVLNPVFEMVKNKISTASQAIFKNMTCYKGIGAGAGDNPNCTNFFNYIKGLLTLYIMGYAFMFLLGVVQISQTDLIIRVIKIGFVAGLMNEGTFEFFNNYVFNFITGFSDSIISNMSGYSLFGSSGGSVTNPFKFLTALLTKIFMSKTFMAQMMSMIAMGINGVIYFIITFITLIMLVIIAFRAIAVYLMALVSLSVLIGLAPLFLTFMLFEFTFYLFDNWIKFTFRYMMEPVIMMAGIIILTQLFTIYLDYITGYSVCWKCAMPITIPFPDIAGLPLDFLKIPLFCISWFAPWGFDHFSGVMGINIQHIVALMIIAYCLWGYIDFASKITARLVGGAGGPSATEMGGNMSGSIEKNVLKKVGLDANSRAQIKSDAKGRLANLSSGANRKSLDSSNRLDMQSSATGTGSGANRGDGLKGETQSARSNTETSQQKNAAQSSSSPVIGAHRMAATGNIPTIDNNQKPSSFQQGVGKQRSASTGGIPKPGSNNTAATQDALKNQRAQIVQGVPKPEDRLDVPKGQDNNIKGDNSSTTPNANTNQTSAEQRKDNAKVNDNKQNDAGKEANPSAKQGVNADQTSQEQRKDNTKVNDTKSGGSDNKLDKDDSNKEINPATQKDANTKDSSQNERKDTTNNTDNKTDSNNNDDSKKSKTEPLKDQKDK